ncbi:SigE family RNA polymerase sigma factor [Planosporangium sp. 12N6]|uniref:SigE family RNA polymerase sigma factor n=1 Tax=Planosporangium spinosum TaxID=3402278 RepID=UPI003CEED3EE
MAAYDRQGFIDYARLIRPWLHREAYRLCRDWHEADDLVQIALYRMYRRWDQLREQSQLAAYARRVLLNTYLSEHRRLRWRYEISQPQLPGQAESSATQQVDDQVYLAAALKRLGPRQRAVVALRFYADLSVEQTAEVLGCSAGTVTSQTHRALTTLRTMLRQRGW